MADEVTSIKPATKEEVLEIHKEMAPIVELVSSSVASAMVMYGALARNYASGREK